MNAPRRNIMRPDAGNVQRRPAARLRAFDSRTTIRKVFVYGRFALGEKIAKTDWTSPAVFRLVL
jgi:hypothetical protein